MTNKRKRKRIRNFQKRNVRVLNLTERRKLFQKYLEKIEVLSSINLINTEFIRFLVLTDQSFFPGYEFNLERRES